MNIHPQSEDAAIGDWYVLIHGLKPEMAPIRFSFGLTLKALEAPLTVFDLASLGASGFRPY
jgi:hypothetical protein